MLQKNIEKLTFADIVNVAVCDGTVKYGRASEYKHQTYKQVICDDFVKLVSENGVLTVRGYVACGKPNERQGQKGKKYVK